VRGDHLPKNSGNKSTYASDRRINIQDGDFSRKAMAIGTLVSVKFSGWRRRAACRQPRIDSPTQDTYNSPNKRRKT
jgi:hypothetical protein